MLDFAFARSDARGPSGKLMKVQNFRRCQSFAKDGQVIEISDVQKPQHDGRVFIVPMELHRLKKNAGRFSIQVKR